MAINVKLDLDNCYPITPEIKDQTIRKFNTELADGQTLELGVRILQNYMAFFGVKYYLRMLRMKDAVDELNVDREDMMINTARIAPETRSTYEKMHNYLIFRLKDRGM